MFGPNNAHWNRALGDPCHAILPVGIELSNAMPMDRRSVVIRQVVEHGDP